MGGCPFVKLLCCLSILLTGANLAFSHPIPGTRDGENYRIYHHLNRGDDAGSARHERGHVTLREYRGDSARDARHPHLSENAPTFHPVPAVDTHVVDNARQYGRPSTRSVDDEATEKPASIPSEESASRGPKWWSDFKAWLGIGANKGDDSDAAGGGQSKAYHAELDRTLSNSVDGFLNGEKVSNSSSEYRDGKHGFETDHEGTQPERVSKFERDIDKALEDLEEDGGSGDENGDPSEMYGHAQEHDPHYHGVDSISHQEKRRDEHSDGHGISGSTQVQYNDDENEGVEEFSAHQRSGSIPFSNSQASELSLQEISSMVRAFHWLFRALDQYVSEDADGSSFVEPRRMTSHVDSEASHRVHEKFRDTLGRGETAERSFDERRDVPGDSGRDFRGVDDDDHEYETDRYVRNKNRKRSDRRIRAGEWHADADIASSWRGHRPSRYDRYRDRLEADDRSPHPISTSFGRKPLTIYHPPSRNKLVPQWGNMYDLARDWFPTLRFPALGNL